ncbi:HIT family protein [Streptomyces sp. NPDC003032]
MVSEPVRAAVVDCMACALADGSLPLPGGTLLRTAHWTVEHCVGPLGVGTLLVKPLRHATGVHELTPEEAAESGPLLSRAAAAVRVCVEDCEQVYVCLWSHAGRTPGHLHFVVQPARTADIDRHGGLTFTLSRSPSVACRQVVRWSGCG